MTKQKILIKLCLCISLIELISCQKEQETICEGKPYVSVNFSGKRKIFADPNSHAQHTFYYLNAINKSSNQTCTPDSKQCFVGQHVYFSKSEDFSTNVTEVDASTVVVPALKADETIELESRIDFHETGFYKIV